MQARRIFVAEFFGTLSLLAIVVGSGIMAERLAGGNGAIALLANATATAAGLYVLILLLAPISGAHFNPAVTLALRLNGGRLPATVPTYVAAQLIGAVLGVILAHAMFDLPPLQPGTHARAGLALGLSEGVATFGLLMTILLGQRFRAKAIPTLVAGYIFAAYWFTASTSFANPAATLARSLTTTYAGIRPTDAAVFIAAQLIGSMLAVGFARWLLPSPSATADSVNQTA